MTQYGVRTKDGYVHHEPHWNSPAEIMKGAHGHGDLRRISEWGELVFLTEDGEWKDVDHGSTSES